MPATLLTCTLTVRRSETGGTPSHFFCASVISVLHSTSAKEGNFVFPLYLYPNGDLAGKDLFAHGDGRRPNLATPFVAEMEQRLQLKFVADGCGNLKRTFGPEDVFHYAYAIFHSPSYRERYAEFLRMDFPRLPLTKDAGLFRRLCVHGRELVLLHLMREHGPELTSFPVSGENVVEQVVYVPPQAVIASDDRKRKQQAVAVESPPPHAGGCEAGPTGRVYINARQYFEGIPPVVWQFRIGGYQVGEKWLKDRKGRALTHDDLEHYSRLVSALAETRTLMARIDALIADHGGWPLR